MTKTKERKMEAMEYLRKNINPGDTVYTLLRGVAKSGMSRRIDVYVIKNNRPVFLTSAVADSLGYSYSTERWAKKGGMVVKGCGMDMGFSVTQNIAIALFCPGKYDHDKAYSLKHEWL